MSEQSGNTIGATVPDGWHTMAKAARLVGRSRDTLRRWKDDDIFIPSGYMQSGQLQVALYSDADIEAMKELSKTLHPGKRRKTSA